MKKINIKQSFGIFVIFVLSILLLACPEDALVDEQQENLKGQEGLAVVSFTVGDSISRTVLPQVSLANVASYKLMGGVNGATETELLEFTTGTASVSLPPGTWNFTLNAYNSSNEHILQGKVQNHQINPTGINQVSFSLAVINSGTGNIHITLNFPNEAGITQIKTTGDVTAETFGNISNGNFAYTKNGIASGDYFVNFELYRGNVLRAVVSELVLVRSNLTSSKTITLVGDDLKPLLTGTVSITGNAIVGETLTANTSALNGIGTISYQWKCGTTNIGTDSSAYTILAADVGGAITVTVTREGYVDSVASSPTAAISALINFTFNSVTANGSSTQTTTQLTLTFSQAITGLTANDITLSGVSGVQKGTLSGSGSTYTLPISGFTSGGTLNVAVEKAGFTVSGSPKTAAIYYATSVAFNGATANGSAMQTTTELTLAFSQAIAGLVASDITLSGVSGVQKGTLSVSGSTYTLPISVFTTGGTLNVAVEKAGFTISGSPKTANIYYYAVTFNSVTANGSSTQTTTELTLTFSQSITGLTANDITLSGVSGVQKGTLSGSGSIYTLPISGFTSGGILTVAVVKSGFSINGSSKTVTIYHYFPGVEMVLIPAGTYTRGISDIQDYGASPPHQVTLSRGFYMGKYEVTQEQYQAVMGTNPSFFHGGSDREPSVGETQSRRPVEMVSWYDAVEFCNKLSALEGFAPAYTITNRSPSSGYPITSATVTANWSANGYRLPTEAEWEYAFRAGTTTPWSFGSTESQLGNYAWYYANSSYKTHEVGKKQPNAWGLYDIHGNVWEWCWDWYGTYASGAQTDPCGAVSGTIRVIRGGSWLTLRSTFVQRSGSPTTPSSGTAILVSGWCAPEFRRVPEGNERSAATHHSGRGARRESPPDGQNCWGKRRTEGSRMGYREGKGGGVFGICLYL